ncbi:MAG: GNAT family N-acetyltransferase [Pseudomonadota bacterium]
MIDTAFEIRPAAETDIDEIVHFNQRLAKETEDKDLDIGVLRTGVANLLADSRIGNYWVAIHDSAPVGQIMVTTEWSDWRNGFFWWIQSVYVVPNWRKRGVFRALYDTVRNAAHTHDAVGLRLYVEKENVAAIATYEALGMKEPGYRMMEVDFKEVEAAC